MQDRDLDLRAASPIDALKRKLAVPRAILLRDSSNLVAAGSAQDSSNLVAAGSCPRTCFEHTNVFDMKILKHVYLYTVVINK